MNSKLTEIVFILDESGSMYDLQSDTIGGFNSMLAKQKSEEGDAYVTTYFFNDSSRMIHDRLPVEKVENITDKDYVPSGCTALIDALGEAINHISDIHKYQKEEDKPGQTIFIITTDGMENASHKFTSDQVKAMVEAKKELGWNFIFLGANIDAVNTAKSYGISEECAVQFECDSIGTKHTFASMNNAICMNRRTGKLDRAWKKEVENDFAKRGKKK